MIYGYARVPTDGQIVAAQVRQLRAAGAGKVFRETASGAKTDRAPLRRILDQLDAGNLLVTRLDRLTRSTRDFLNARGDYREESRFPVLDDSWADKTASHGRLMLIVLDGLAEFERDLIRTRPAEGRSRAKAQGKHIGRPSRLTDAQKAEARRRRAQGATLSELARSRDVSESTTSRLT